MEVFGIGGGELFLLLLFAVIVFGPEKLPEFSRKVARVLFTIRVMANQATNQLKEELGPEYADLTLADLNPKTFVRKNLLADVEEDLADIKNEISEVKNEFGVAKSTLNSASREITQTVKESAPAGSAALSAAAGAVAAGKTAETAATGKKAASAASPLTASPFDPEAT